MQKMSSFKLKPLLIGLVVTLLIVACQNRTVRQPSDSQLADCRTVEHLMGEVCVPKEPERLISLDNSTFADAFALGVPSIAVSSHSDLADYLVEKSVDVEFLGKSAAPSLERMSQLNPDLIVGIELFTKSTYPQLSQIAPTAVGKWIGNPSWQEHFDFVARVLGKEKEAQAVWADYDRRIEELKAALGDRAQDLEISLAYACCGQISMDATNSFVGSILADLGIRQTEAQTVIGDGTIPLSEERLMDLDADLLFMSIYDEESEQILADWQRKPLWNQLQVVQNKQVYLVNADVWRAGDPLAANLVIDDLYKYLVEQR